MRTQLAIQKRPQKLFRWAVAAGVVLLGLLINELVGERGFLSHREQHREIQALSEEIEKLKQENLQLTERIQNLRSDPATIEELAREQLQLGRPGEMIVALPDSAAKKEDAARR